MNAHRDVLEPLFARRGAAPPRAPTHEMRDGWHHWTVAAAAPRMAAGEVVNGGAEALVWFFDRTYTDSRPGQFVAEFEAAYLRENAAVIRRRGLLLDGGEPHWILRPPAAATALDWLDRLPSTMGKFQSAARTPEARR